MDRGAWRVKTPVNQQQNPDAESSAQRGHLGSQPRLWGVLTFLIPKSSKDEALTRPPGLRITIARSQKKELERSSKQMGPPPPASLFCLFLLAPGHSLAHGAPALEPAGNANLR